MEEISESNSSSLFPLSSSDPGIQRETIIAERNDGDELELLEKYPIDAQRVSALLADSLALESTLANHHMLPTVEETQLRKDAFSVLRDIILGASERKSPVLSDVPLEVVPIGSYALGVWTSTSDINCLCVGSISSKTFFSLAGQRIRRAESLGVRLLRKVEANTGTMYELRVNDIRMNLQYCPAARILER